MWKTSPASKHIAALICVYFLALTLLYADATPFFEAPDEAAHFLYAHNLLETGELPTLLEGRDAIFASQATQRHHPPLYYMVGAVLIAPTDRADVDAYLRLNPLGTSGTVSVNNQNVYLHNWRSPEVEGGDTATAIWILRLFSMALGLGTLWMIYRIGALTYGEPVGLLAMLITASIPTFVFISASINNDNLVTFFYTAGILWTVRSWQQKAIRPRDVALISAILAGVALSKVNGLTLFGLVYGGMVLGVLRGRYGWRRVLLVVIVSGVSAALAAGWWYLRNEDLYGDPLARGIMRGIWGRGYPPEGWDEISAEAESVWVSFWMILGQFNVRGPEWFYDILPAITGLGALGALIHIVRDWRRWEVALFLLTAVVLVIVSLIAANQEIKVSQGRILFPMLGAFAPLLALGWYTLPRRLGVLVIVPLVVVTLSAPIDTLYRAYPRLSSTDAERAGREGATLVERTVRDGGDSMALIAYKLDETVVQPGDVVRGTVYFSAETVADVALSMQLVDTISGGVRGGVVTYPGMTLTSQLRSGWGYRAAVQFQVAAAETPIPPRQMMLDFSWPVLAESGIQILRTLTWESATGEPTGGGLLVPGPLVHDPAYQPMMLETPLDLRFGEGIQATGYTVSDFAPRPGEVVQVHINWRGGAQMNQDWTLTVGLLSAEGVVVAQQDGPIPGYPTSRWLTDVTITETRTLALPAELPSGDYVLYFGWYDPANDARLPISGGGADVRDNLYRVPVPVGVTGS